VMLSRLRVSDWSVVGCIAAASLTRRRDAYALPARVFALVITDTVGRADLAVLVGSHSDSPVPVAVLLSRHVPRLARAFQFSESVA